MGPVLVARFKTSYHWKKVSTHAAVLASIQAPAIDKEMLRKVEEIPRVYIAGWPTNSTASIMVNLPPGFEDQWKDVPFLL
jgi:hypothetical protein